MIECTRRDGILEITITQPPINVLGAALSQALLNVIALAQSDDKVTAITIRSEGKGLSAGADITDFGKAPAADLLSETADAIEASTKPVVAAIDGIALGGGLEIALACHFRIATPDAALGLPEVTLGLLPSAGGTQRLPRLVGVEAALDLIVSGRQVTGREALALKLVDRLATDGTTLRDEAAAFARTLGAPVRTGAIALAPTPETFERFMAAQARKIRGLDAPIACVNAVRAATELPLKKGLALERKLFLKLLDGPQSAALRHAFVAERTTAKIDGLPRDTGTRRISRVGVIGAGTMGGGISMNFLSEGIPVTLLDMSQEALDKGVATIRKNYEASVGKGRFTAGQVSAAMRCLTATRDFDALANCDLIIEAVYEDMAIKTDIFSKISSIAGPEAILASNTSYLSIDEIAAATDRPHDVVGLHFFSPANIMKLVEVVRGADTAPDVLATGMALARRIGKVPVVAGVCHGFIGNRMLMIRRDEAVKLILEGASLEQVDKVHTDFGLPMGPFRMADLAGIDLGWHRDPTRIETLRDALCAQGRLGQKTNAGYYDYDDGRRATSAPAVARIIARFRDLNGIVARSIADEEIMVRTMYTMINEAAVILEGGYAQRGSDIDAVWIHGYGWPRHTGGPIYWANHYGIDRIVADLDRYRDRLDPGFRIAPLLERCSADGKPLDRAARQTA